MISKEICWRCGKTATRTLAIDWKTGEEIIVTPWYRCYCDDCRDFVKAEEEQEHILYIRLKKKEMFKKACAMLESQNTRMYEYKEAIDVVENHIIENPDKYDSSYEVLATIILIHNRVHCIRQYKVGRYMIDFLLPELKVALEIDGDRHKHNKAHDSKRDKEIQFALGTEWNIIRIDTKYLDQNAKKLLEAIEKIKDCRIKSK